MMKGIRKMSVRDYIRALFVDIIKEQLKENSNLVLLRFISKLLTMGLVKQELLNYLHFI